MEKEGGKKDLKEKVKEFFGEDYRANFCKVAITHEMVILPSFHRCGNTLTRELLEGITGIVTGSDDHHLTPYIEPIEKKFKSDAIIESKNHNNESLLKFKGQWIIDQSVWIYKTHYPARIGKGLFHFDKILLVVRNPFDAIDSMFNLYLTNSHSKSIKKEEYQRLFHDWEGLVKEEIVIWNKFYEFWINYSKNNNARMLIIRYEDLILDSKKEIMNVHKFILDFDRIDDTFVEKSVDSYMTNRRTIYKPRKGTSLHSLENYTKDQIIFILENSIQMFQVFEYDKTFEDLILKYYLKTMYEEQRDKDKTLRTFTELNLNQLSTLANMDNEYHYEYIQIPVRKNPPSEINSEEGMLKYCDHHRSGGRVARLSSVISKIVEIEETIEKEDKKCEINDNI
jgi:hypothetical protein